MILIGNLVEWTTELSNTAQANAVFRGGSFYNGTDPYAFTTRQGQYSSTNVFDLTLGFRVVLYIK